ncbi:MAG: CARDB domain-containing protein [Polyangiaceae bacterium]|nr:CARDB domain-containing protein [Polyangiaceae bacterium]
MRQLFRRALLGALGLGLSGGVMSSGCSSGEKPGPLGSGPDGAIGGAAGSGVTPTSGGASSASGGSGFMIPIDGSGGSSAGSGNVDPCGALNCGPGQACMLSGSTATCVNRECSQLNCASGTHCMPHPMGGNVCAANCTGDVQCPAEQFCDGTSCMPDACTPGTSVCQGNQVLECPSNGSANQAKASCGSGAYFTSQCAAAGGSASCSCEDDWDCPAYTTCEVGACVGTGKAPTCTLPPLPFGSTPPAVELHWGGDGRADLVGHDGTPGRAVPPWGSFNQVISTPIVANLDDDNGDGLINERDFPEILFTSHKGDHPWDNGVVRAVHGGGARKGADYFARCGTKVWQESANCQPGAGGTGGTGGVCDPLANIPTCGDNDPDGDSGAPVAVGDLNYDGVPEIVYGTDSNKFNILDNEGNLLYALQVAWTPSESGETISIVNLDFAGFAEIIVGRAVYVLGNDAQGKLIVTHKLSGGRTTGTNQVSAMTCAADLRADKSGMEFVAGTALYRMPDTLPACQTPPCSVNLELVWDASAVNVDGNNAPILTGDKADGFCAVADVWGANVGVAPGPLNPPDGKPEVVLISDGYLMILDSQTGQIIDRRNLNGGARGGAPNVDDFDGDGFAEIGSALQDFFVVVDLQEPTAANGACAAWPTTIARATQQNGSHNSNPARNPGGGVNHACTQNSDCAAGAFCNVGRGECSCYHNGWQRDSDDDSSRATSSSVFDFNGDGAAEALYNDECDFRVYDGSNGEILYSELSRSRTGIENPVVADVDNDGNAEIVTGMNTAEPNRCDDDPGGIPLGPQGIRVWGDPSDTWVSARRIWNQQSYHVTNVTEGGQIPLHAPESWKPLNGRLYNTYRSQPRSFGSAPDLTVTGLGVSSPDVACGTLSDTLLIAFEVKNAGDLRVGPGVVVSFSGEWNQVSEALKNEQGQPLTFTLNTSLEPGASVVLNVTYKQASNGHGSLPSRITVTVDSSPGMPAGTERECREDNNNASSAVDAGAMRADLAILLGAAGPVCPDATVVRTVRNLGNSDASNVLVRYYAGDPAQGGMVLFEETLPMLAAGATDMKTVTIPGLPGARSITIYAVVDPNDTVVECNNANNRDSADNPVICESVVR